MRASKGMRTRTVMVVMKVYGPRRAAVWLTTPHPGLKARPCDLMHTVDGCRKVEALLQ